MTLHLESRPPPPPDPWQGASEEILLLGLESAREQPAGGPAAKWPPLSVATWEISRRQVEGACRQKTRGSQVRFQRWWLPCPRRSPCSSRSRSLRWTLRRR